MMPKVSVIMGVLNSQETISKAIESIVSQTFKDWEFIICDDGSTDETYNIVYQYSLKDRRIKLIKNEKNMGLAYSLNNCIEHSMGDYIARMDADDVSHSDRFEKQLKFLELNPQYDFVSCSTLMFDEDGVWGVLEGKPEPVKKDFLYGACFNHPTIIFRKESLIKASCYNVAKETRRCEDYDLFMRMYLLNMTGFNMREPLFSYYESRRAYSKRTYKYRIDEAVVRFKGYRSLKILFPLGIIFVFKPLVVGLIPARILHAIKQRLYKKNDSIQT
ncbi:glycosyltransferase [Bacillus sp. JJ1503]|uniref:glycosyltransferase family 2 protein n=1 Tax=Bacillus sp. JJ1503 TaxID=3122956 RepID=UPI002FFDE434